MLISLNWLKKYVDVNADPEEISRVLTNLGLEVEEVQFAGVDSPLLVSAYVESCEKHPDAEKLSLCKVNDGSESFQVVCGAPNVAAGQKVIFAKVGAVLPGNFKIKKAKIRGVESFGMICAEDEIGLGDSHDGIIELPANTPLGIPLKNLPGLCDVIFDISITPNRPDALCHLGVARELAAFYGLKMNNPVPQKVEAATPSNSFSIKVDNPEACSMYTAKIISGVKVGPSPGWLVDALKSMGQKSINNIVDLTNYVLLETGHPSHSFDLDKLNGPEIIIRNGKSSEKLQTLDEETRELDSRDLVIADSSGPVCLAGVMGGESTKVDETTSNILLEVAYFDPATIRAQSKRHQLISDSSYRFERGINPLGIEQVSAYLAHLIVDVAGGKIAESPSSFVSKQHPVKPKEISLRLDRVKKVLGHSIPKEDIKRMLEALEVQVTGTDKAKEAYTCLAPGFRPDLEREIDLIEEIARLHDFNNIPDILPSFPMATGFLPPLEVISNKLRNHLSSSGLNEALSLRFAPANQGESLLYSKEEQKEKIIYLKNPLSEEGMTLPINILHNLLQSVSRNQRNQQKDCRLFELGKVFWSDAKKRDAKNPGVIEQDILGIVLCGQWPALSWKKENSEVDFYSIKGLVENALASLGYEAEFKYPANAPYLHPKESAEILVNGQVLGSLGSLHPIAAKNFQIKGECLVGEINLNLLLEQKIKAKQFQSFNNMSSATREMNIVVDKTVSHEQILSWMPLREAKFLQGVKLNSIYEGSEIGDNKKALHYSFTYNHPERSLKDEEINKSQKRISDKLSEIPEISFK